MLLAQRNDDAVVGGRGLQLEIERAAEALAQREAPGAIDARAERRVNDQLHAAAFIEESLGDDGLLRWQRSERGSAGANVERRPVRRRGDRARIRASAIDTVSLWSSDLSANVRDFLGQFDGAARRFAAPERNRGRGAMRILHANAARLHAANAPGSRAEQKHVAGQALDGEVFVQRADDRFFRFGDDVVIRILGNRAAGRDCREPRASAAAHDAVDLIAMQKRAAAAALRGDAFRKHFDDGVEIARGQIAIRIGAAHQLEQIVLVPRLAGCGRNDLLRQNVERPRRNFAARPASRCESREPERRTRSSSSRVVANSRPFGTLFGSTRWPERPMRCSATAIDRGEPIWQTSSTEPISMPSSSDAVATTARNSPFLSFCSASSRRPPRKTSVMRQHRGFTQTLGQMMRDALGEAARIDEYQCRAMSEDQLRQPVVDLGPHLVAGDGAEFILRNFDGEVHFAPVSAVDDLNLFVGREQIARPLRSDARSPKARCADGAPAGLARPDRRAGPAISARCEPRLSSTIAWISSMIIVRAVFSNSRLRSAVSRMKSDSGVVTRMCGGRLTICCRSAMGVSPVRTATRIGGINRPFSRGELRDFLQAADRDSFECRCSAPSAARRRRPKFRPEASRPARPAPDRSRQERNAASVLPDPVGAEIRTSRPP